MKETERKKRQALKRKEQARWKETGKERVKNETERRKRLA